MLVDDYGHHPTELAAVIAAARPSGRRIVIAFQPHRYSRTRDLMEEFGAALGAADEVILTDIYPAGEAPIEGVTVDALASAIRRAAACPLHVVRNLGDVPRAVAQVARAGDLVITLGAGTIGTIGEAVLAALAEPAFERREGEA
jgi:UDP-N-acetylmuramate--alanine ligase